jgi:hypothetical protein
VENMINSTKVGELSLRKLGGVLSFSFLLHLLVVIFLPILGFCGSLLVIFLLILGFCSSLILDDYF